MLEDGNPWLSILWMLFCVVLITGAAYWFTRRVVGRGGLGALGKGRGRQMELLDQLPVGREQRLVMVRAGERFFLLGITAGEISALAEFTEEEAAAWREAPETRSGTGTPGFREALQKMLEQKGRR